MDVPSASAVWVHNIDPVLLPIWGPLKLRWYGLAYLLGFAGGYFLLRHLARRGLYVLKESEVADFIAYAAIFGVFLGGRLGYVLFYSVPESGWGAVLEDPLQILRVWDGGMASHGGIIGLALFSLYWARRKQVSWLGLGDGLCVVAGVGLFCGRMANFINGELYGRVSSGVAWLMKFPHSLVAFKPPSPESKQFHEAMREAVATDPERLAGAWEAYAGPEPQLSGPGLLEVVLAAGRENPEVTGALAPYLEPRHPSQLYEAILEGALVFALLWFLRVHYPRMRHGVLTGLFFILYAVFRIVVEGFREPDSTWVVENVLTKGQFYSVFMIVVGAAFLGYGLRKGGRLEPQEG